MPSFICLKVKYQISKILKLEEHFFKKIKKKLEEQ
jgi:hypothetical protein